MRTHTAVALLLLLTVVKSHPALAQDLVAPTEPLTAEEQLKKFYLPPGFEIQLVAAEPEIRKPINLNFDADGRLFATQSVEYPFPASGDAPHRDLVRVFEDLQPSGNAGRASTYIGGLNIPIGVLPIHGGLLYYTIPAIHFAADSGGRGEQPQVLYREFGFRDTHGMASSFTRWVDGWIYACHGFSNDSEVRGADGATVKMNSGNTFRMRRDGSHIEQFTWGQVNPFGLTFDPLGNLYSSDCHTLPAYMLLRGAHYPSFGKPHDGLGFGPEMIRHNHGSTGIAGIVYYAADHFPPEYRDTLFIGNPVTGRINHDKLESHGSTYQAIEQPDFLRCDDPWFRPVDIKLGPDGALYIADFYNRIIGHYEVPLTHPQRDRERGRIWRIIYTGIDGEKRCPQMPKLSEASVDQLIAALAHPNLTVQVAAVDQLVERCGEQCLETVEGIVRDGDTSQRALGLWVIERLTGLEPELVARLAADPDRLVRVHLIKALGERADWPKIEGTSKGEASTVVAALQDKDAFVRRAAADALSRHPAHEHVKPLLDAWASAPEDDSHLVHTIRMALRDQFLLDGAYDAFAELAAAEREHRKRVAEISLGVPNATAASWLLGYLSDNPTRRGFAAQIQHVARHIEEEKLPRVYALALKKAASPRVEQSQILQSLQTALGQRSIAMPAKLNDWAAKLVKELLQDASEPAARQGIELARQSRLAEVYAEILAAATPDARHPPLRGLALEAAAAINAAATVDALGRILREDEPIELRQKAAALLGGINTPQSHSALVAQLDLVPERLAVEIAAALATTPSGGELLLKVAGEGKASPRLLLERTVRERLNAGKIENVDKRVEELTRDLPPRDDRLVALVQQRRAGYDSAKHDVGRGQQVFQKTCAACHRLAGQGNKIGPELDGIGVRGIDRLLEDVLDPNRNVDQAFRTTQVVTTGGQVISGLLLREEGETLVLADSQGKETRVAKSEIDEQRLSNLSPMPANVADLLNEEEFYHLIAFLLEQKQSAKE